MSKRKTRFSCLNIPCTRALNLSESILLVWRIFIKLHIILTQNLDDLIKNQTVSNSIRRSFNRSLSKIPLEVFSSFFALIILSLSSSVFTFFPRLFWIWKLFFYLTSFMSLTYGDLPKTPGTKKRIKGFEALETLILKFFFIWWWSLNFFNFLWNFFFFFNIISWSEKLLIV